MDYDYNEYMKEQLSVILGSEAQQGEGEGKPEFSIKVKFISDVGVTNWLTITTEEFKTLQSALTNTVCSGCGSALPMVDAVATNPEDENTTFVCNECYKKDEPVFTLKGRIVIEDMTTGNKKIISTMREFVVLEGDEKAAGRAFINEGGERKEQRVNNTVARRMQPFELL